MRRAKVESTIWNGAQVLAPEQHGISPLGDNGQSMEHTRVCYVDGAWRQQDVCTGQGWYCRTRGTSDVMMGAMNLHCSLSPLHAECEALIWAMECMKTLQFSDVVIATDCSQLVKMVSAPEDCQLLLHIWKNSAAVRLSSLVQDQTYSKAQNTMADKLARGARSSPSSMLYVDSVPPVWLAQPMVST